MYIRDRFEEIVSFRSSREFVLRITKEKERNRFESDQKNVCSAILYKTNAAKHVRLILEIAFFNSNVDEAED